MSRPSSSKENAPTEPHQPKSKPNNPLSKRQQDENLEEELFKKLNDLLRQNRKTSKSKDELPSNDFCCDAVIEQLPRIVVGDDCWELKYPCDAEVATKLLTLASKAPVGKGTETVMDMDVRDGWQIEAEKVKFLGERWASLFSDSSKSKLLESVRKVLAPDCKKISAKFYKLLIYEKDSFFKPHRDTQRQPNHFGSIVVFLPSCYSGGEFSVEHGDAIRRFSFGLAPDSDALNPHMVAFFTDCMHEVKSVTSGCRVTMSYQLFYEGSALPAVPKSLSIMEKDISDSLSKLFELPKLKGKEAAGLFLQHRYALASLSPLMLKGIDRVVYNAISASGLFDVEVVAVAVDSGGQVGCDDRRVIYRSAEHYYKEGLTEEGARVTVRRYDPLTLIERHRCRSPCDIVTDHEREKWEDEREARRYDRESFGGSRRSAGSLLAVLASALGGGRPPMMAVDGDDDDDEEEMEEEEEEEDDRFPSELYDHSPRSSSDEDVDYREKTRGEELSSFGVGEFCGEDVRGPVVFINDMKDVRINDVIGRSTSSTGNEGTEFELLYTTAALLIKPKNRTASATSTKKATKRGRNK